MCTIVEKSKTCYFFFDHEQYDKEVSLMRKRIKKMLHKVEQTKKELK